jgi:hypothetical protein
MTGANAIVVIIILNVSYDSYYFLTSHCNLFVI